MKNVVTGLALMLISGLTQATELSGSVTFTNDYPSGEFLRQREILQYQRVCAKLS